MKYYLIFQTDINKSLLHSSFFSKDLIVVIILITGIVGALNLMYFFGYVDIDYNNIPINIMDKLEMSKLDPKNIDELVINKPLGWRSVEITSVLPALSLTAFVYGLKFILNKDLSNISKFLLISFMGSIFLILFFLTIIPFLSNACHFIMQMYNWIIKQRSIEKGYQIKLVLGFTHIYTASLLIIYLCIITLLYCYLDEILIIFVTKHYTEKEKLQFFFKAILVITTIFIVLLLVMYIYNQYIKI